MGCSAVNPATGPLWNADLTMDEINWAYAIVGIVFVGLVLLDVIWTTVWVGGKAGPMAGTIARVNWVVFRPFRKRHRLPVLMGPLTLIITVIAWLLLLWAGWTAVFLSQPTAVLDASTKVPADIFARVYFVGYTIFTMGNGGYSPNGSLWQVITAIASGSGLFVATLAITYLLSVISAAVSARALAVTVNGLGDNADQIVAAGWNGSDFSSLNLPINSLSEKLAQLSQQYRAYPVLQYFHVSQQDKSPIFAIGRLEQILSVSSNAVKRNARAPEIFHNSLRSAIEEVLETFPDRFVRPAENALPTPELTELSLLGLSVASDQFAKELGDERTERRRKKIAGLLQEHGWESADAR